MDSGEIQSTIPQSRDNDSTGQESPDNESNDQESPNIESTGQEFADNDSTGQESPGLFQLIEQIETAVDKLLERQVASNNKSPGWLKQNMFF
jgi:hypothetical protein